MCQSPGMAAVGYGGFPKMEIYWCQKPLFGQWKKLYLCQVISLMLKIQRNAIIFEDYEIKAFGFSKCGNYIAVCNSHTLDIFRKM